MKDETKNLTLYFILHITLYVVLFFFVIFFAWYTVFITTHKFYAVKGVSMMPTLNGQITEEQLYGDINSAQNESYDAVYIDKMTNPRIFDIIVVNKKASSDSVIKRLMAVGGDYITIAKGKTSTQADTFYFYRIPNGEELDSFTDEEAKVIEDGREGYNIYNDQSLWTHYSAPQTYMEKDSQAYEYNFYKTFLSNYGNDNARYNYHVSSNGLIYVQVPEGEVFYMGDNRAYSTDSRERGFCDAKYVEGRAEIILHNYGFGDRLIEVVKFYFKEMEKFFAR